ncbi:hypothetical protein BCR41DRAFT_345581 [Lobosporangium transversale]|uniref:Uncharacterized protein n=1 Tax=Lobosporangium transversale TaxID=64571 RepID=A0A1Y2GZB5_9FUNG|nr:hypothetical protein BCR41DRAFT_345581 [Lobosporangium transversale]ORZ27606.1 hypothetical protein BCR41DRAFT_345581 [Lobosporangium transversale]|eukprot:XP_021885309.1 hypothetical protein BCR41DRAFT_345581 [Lobosporangium transversale]
MDSDWCLFCEKHVYELDAVYCSMECARMDKQTAVASNSLSFGTSMSTDRAMASSIFYSPSMLPLRRPTQQLITVSYPCMFRSSNLAPKSISGRGGVRKGSPSSASSSGGLLAKNVESLNTRGYILNRCGGGRRYQYTVSQG